MLLFKALTFEDASKFKTDMLNIYYNSCYFFLKQTTLYFYEMIRFDSLIKSQHGYNIT